MAADTAAYAYGVPLEDESLHTFSNEEISQWALWIDGDTIHMGALAQSIDIQAIRSVTADPFSTYSPNRYSVKWAIRSVADAAAKLHTSHLLQKYNARAKALFEKSVKALVERHSAEFKELFGELTNEDLPGGWVLLRPVETRMQPSIEGYTFAAQRTGGKRIKLVASAADADGDGVVAYLGPSTSAEYRAAAGSERLPAIGCKPRLSYELMAGTLAEIGSTDDGKSLYDLIRKVIFLNDDQTWLRVETFNGAPTLTAAGVMPTQYKEHQSIQIPTLISTDAAAEIRAYFTPREGGVGLPYTDADQMLERIRDTIAANVDRYKADVDGLLTYLQGFKIGDSYNYTEQDGAAPGSVGAQPLLNDQDKRAVDWTINFLHWVKINAPEHYVVCGYKDLDILAGVVTNTRYKKTEDGESMVLDTPPMKPGDEGYTDYYFASAWPDPTDLTIAEPKGVRRWRSDLRQDLMLPTQARNGPISTVPDVMREIMISRGVIDPKKASAMDCPVSATWFRDYRPSERFVFLMDIKAWTREQHLSVETPSALAGETGEMDPTVLTSAYRPLVLDGENEMRFKLSLMSNLGVNPMYYGGARNPGEFSIDETGDRRDFEADMKHFEFDLQVRDIAGYNEEWRTTMRMVLQVLFSTVAKPQIRDVPGVGSINLMRHMPEGEGFVYTPAAPDEIQQDPLYIERMRVPIKASKQLQFAVSYPTWTEHNIAGASLYMWRNAVATATQPFTEEGTGSNLADVAAMMAMSEPFAPMDPKVQAKCAAMLEAMTAKPRFDPQTCLHLIQLTAASRMPGDSNFTQPFPPKRVHFRGAAIEKTTKPDEPPYRLSYALGTESTILIESIFIGTAALKVLQLNRTAVGKALRKPIGPTDVLRKVPLIHTMSERLPSGITDLEYKQSVLRAGSSHDARFGLTRAFTVPEYSTGVVSLADYADFLQITNPRAMNKAGRALFCDVDYNIRPATASAPGYYTNTASMKMKVPSDFNALDTAAENLAGYYEWLKTDPELAYKVMATPAGRVTAPTTLYNLKHMDEDKFDEIEQKYRMMDGRGTYADFLFTMIVAAYDASTGRYTPRTGQFALDYTANPMKSVALPVYIVEPRNKTFALAGYLHVGGYIEFRGDMSTRRFDPEKMWINGFYALRANVFASRQSLVDEFVESDTYHDGNSMDYDVAAKFRKRRLLPFFEFEADKPVMMVDTKTVETNIAAHNKYTTMTSAVKYATYETKFESDMLRKMLYEGCQGYHYGRVDALSATVFAVAINGMYADIKRWYEEYDDTITVRSADRTEPKGVHTVYPRPQDRNDATLLNLILRSETTGAAWFGKAATSGKSLVTPLIIEVRGPLESSEYTACYVDNVLAKTAEYRLVEQDVIRMMNSHLGLIRSIDSVRNRVTGCLASKILQFRPKPIPSVRWLMSQRPSIVPLMASLMVKLKNYNEIAARSDKPRAPTAVGIAYKDIENLIHNMLFKV